MNNSEIETCVNVTDLEATNVLLVVEGTILEDGREVDNSTVAFTQNASTGIIVFYCAVYTTCPPDSKQREEQEDERRHSERHLVSGVGVDFMIT